MEQFVYPFAALDILKLVIGTVGPVFLTLTGIPEKHDE